ncbi:MAG: aldose 1-epimerase [Actinomycetota bacterium]
MDGGITLRAGEATLRIDPAAGGRVSRLTLGDLDLLAHVDSGSPFHWGSFVMAPWAGRIRRGRFDFDGRAYRLPLNWDVHAIHGTVVDRAWDVTESAADSAALECRFDEQWPWRGFVRHRITLRDGRADFRLEVHATDEPFPASTGWHPWFLRRLADRPVEIKLDASAMLLRDSDGIPSGERVPIPAQPWDDCFDEVRWPVTLLWPDVLRLDVTASTRYAVVYTEHAEGVCVEPQTGPPDALTLDPVVVTPDAPLTATMAWTWRPNRSAAHPSAGASPSP